MAKRALLIGSQTYGLTGCNGDVALVADVLAGRGFDSITTLTDGAASRAGIVAGLEQLVADIEPADAIVLFYSGHGGRVERPDAEQRKSTGRSTHFHFIVPYDMDASEPGDFRGFLSEEMTGFQRRMTDAFLAKGATPNVTTILDCCHSGYFARSAEMIQKSVDLTEKMFRLRGIREHAQQLGAEAASLSGATNPYAVRLVACQPEQSAYELASVRGGMHGALTDAFAAVLGEIGDRTVSWKVVIELIRRRVRALVPEQRPEAEGPGGLAMFSTESVPGATALPLAVSGGLVVIESGMLLGVEVGDEFRLEEPGRPETGGAETGGEESGATAVVTRLEGGNAVLSVTPAVGTGRAGASAVSPGAVAVRTSRRGHRYPVAIDVDGVGGDELRRLVGQSIHVRAAAGDEPPLARVIANEGLVVVDPLGAPWRVSVQADDQPGARATLAVLEEIAIGQRLLDLPSGLGASALDAAVEVELGTMRDGSLHELDRHGARLKTDDRVSLSIRNASTEQIYAWVFDVGVAGRTTLLTNATPSGALLGPAGSADDRLPLWSADGEPLFWPPDVPPVAAPGAHDAARQETFVIVLADRRGDLSSLATTAATARGEADIADLETILGRQTVMTRDAAPQLSAGRPLRYRVEEVSFFLCP